MGTRRSKGHRRRVLLGAATLAVPALAACGPRQEPKPAPSAGVVQLRLHGSSTGAEGDYWPRVANGFNARQSKIRVTFEPWEPNKGALVLGVSGTLGDVMRLVAFGEYSQVAAKGFLKDLTFLVAEDKYDLRQFYPAAVETLKFRNHQFGLPHIAHPGYCAQYVNLDAFSQAGIPLPKDSDWTLSQFQAVAKQLSEAARGGTRWGLWPPTSIQHVTVAARAHGGNVLSKDGKKAIVAEPAAMQGVHLLADLILRDQAAPPPGMLQGSDVQNLISNQVAMVWTNFGIINTLRKQAQGLQWKVLMGPRGPQGRGFFMGVDAASQSAASKYPDEAFDLVKYVVSKDVSLGWFDFGFAPGARPDTWNDMKVTADPAYRVFSKAMNEAAPLLLPDNGLITDFNNAVARELSNIWTGQVSVRDGVEAARRAGQEVLDRPA